jgi:hypothetical protein
MQFLKDNKLYIGLVIVAVLGWWLYMTYFAGSASDASLLTTPQESPLSQDVLTTLSNLTVIRLDPSIFSDPVFTSLTDYGVQIPAENVGRRNPFAPL